MNIKLLISYDGSEFFGSQIQPKSKTVHGTIVEALKILNIETKLNFSGRTDKDVHAFKQVINCEIPHHWKDLKEFKYKLNNLLPDSIFIRDIHEVHKSFHARFSAKHREYRYLITDKSLTPFNSKYLGYYKTIDEVLIKEVIQVFIGTHDFKFFSKTGSEPESTVREIYSIKFYKYKNIYVLKFCANSYLRSQIRMMVDAIMKVSSGKLSCDDIKLQLDGQKRSTWTLASPSGLYLSKITY